MSILLSRILGAFVGCALLSASATALAASPKSNAITYYVDSQGGNDARSGVGPASAWKSLSKVNATTFSPGDHILFKSGSAWTGQLFPKGSGAPGKPIVIDKYGGSAKPQINAEGQAEDAFLLKNQEYWEVNNLELSNKGESPAVRRGVHVSVENFGDAHHIYLRSLTIHDVNGIDREKVNGGIHYTSVGDRKPSRFVDLRIENNHIYHVDRSGIFGWSTHWQRSTWYPSLGVVVRGNRLEDIGGDGIVVVATDGAVVEHNVVGHANQRSEGYDVAIWAWSADNTLIQYNEAFATRGERDGEGFDSDWNSRNTVIQYNYSHDNDGGFLLICDEGGHGPDESIGNYGTIVRYNISVNDHNRGINVAGPVKDSTIYNNTFFVGKNENVSLLLHSDWKGWADGTFLYNNIFFVVGKASFSYGTSRDASGHYTTAPGFGQSKDNVFDFNLYYGNLERADDPHALMADPMLVDPGRAGGVRFDATWYRLKPGSPAINSGKSIDNNGGKDFLGVAVSACGKTDRGALESTDCRSVKR